MAGWEERFGAYVERLGGVLGHADRRQPLRAYAIGLLLPGERKSVEPMAARVEPRRWRVEQTFGCLMRYRRLQVDHEGGTGMSRMMAPFAALFMTGARFERQIMP